MYGTIFSLYVTNHPLLKYCRSPYCSESPTGNTVSTKRKYTLLSSRVLKTKEAHMESTGCATPTIELVHTGPSHILKFKEMVTYQQKP